MSKVARRIAVLLAVLVATPVDAAVTGYVIHIVEQDGKQIEVPIEGARVRVQATPGEPVITDETGWFSVEVDDPFEPETITAVVPHDSSRETNFIVGSLNATDGQEITIQLTPLIDDDPGSFTPQNPDFTCANCHAAQYSEWEQSNHSHAAENEWVLDLFEDFRQTHDEDDTGFCATCHAPLQDALAGGVMLDDKDVQAASSGVDCQACHLMSEVNDDFPALHHLGNAQYYFAEDSSIFWVWGPLDDVTGMQASYQPQFSQAKFCASCHEYENPLNPGIPGQTTYSEWKQSPFGPEGENRPCQSCHMRGADIQGPIVSIGGPIRPPEQRRNHEFTGATPETLSGAIDLDLDVGQEGGRLVVSAEVANNGAGHYFPTGISIRNGILHIEAEYDGQLLSQTAGPVVPFYGSASEGDDPDRDLAGRPGRGFARVLEGRINGEGPTVYPVLFIDAENVREETRIPSGESDLSAYRFDLSGVPEGVTIEVRARLLYRRAWRDLEVRKGWTQTPAGGPIEIEVQSESQDWVVQELPPDEVFFDRFE